MSTKGNDLRNDLAAVIGSLNAVGSDRPYWEQDARFLNPFAAIKEIPVWGTIGGRPALPRQGIITFSAKPKQGKSLSTYAILQIIMSGAEFDAYKAAGERPRLAIVFDTEMDLPTLQTRYITLRKQLGENADRVQIVPLIGTPKEDRRGVVEEMTRKYDPDIIVIDQVARMVKDYNDAGEAVEFGEWLLSIAADKSAMVVIHQNKATDNDQMKGHLGSIMNELAVENYKVRKSKGNIYSVEVVNSRHTCIDEAAPFTFAINEGNITDPSDIVNAQNAEHRLKWWRMCQQAFGDAKELRSGELQQRIKDVFDLNDEAAKNIIRNAREFNSIVKTENCHRAPYRLADLDPN